MEEEMMSRTSIGELDILLNLMKWGLLCTFPSMISVCVRVYVFVHFQLPKIFRNYCLTHEFRTRYLYTAWPEVWPRYDLLVVHRGTSVMIASPSHIQKYPEGLFLAVHHVPLSSWYSGSRHGGCHGWGCRMEFEGQTNLFCVAGFVYIC